MKDKLVSEMLTEYSKEKVLSYSNEEFFDILAIAREILDSDYLRKKGEVFATESFVTSPFCVVLMLVRTIELMQEEKVTYTITADGAQLLSAEAKLEELEIIFKDITDASLKGKEYVEYFLKDNYEKYDIVSNNVEKLEELGFYIKSIENEKQDFGAIIIW